MKNRDFRQDCDAVLQNVVFDGAQQARVRERVAAGRTPHRWRRRSVAAVLVAALMCTGAFAGRLIQDSIRQTMTSWEQGHTGTPLHLSASDGGYTVTLDELYGDTMRIYLKGTVTREDGEPLSVYQFEQRESSLSVSESGLRFMEHDWRIAGYEDWTWRYIESYFLPDADTQDNKLEFIMRLSGQDLPMEGTLELLLQDMAFWREDSVLPVPEGSEEEEQHIDGTWRFTVPIARADSSETMPVNRSVQTAAGAITLDSLYFSALDVAAHWSGANEALFERYSEGSTYLLLKNGEKLYAVGRTADAEDGTHIVMTFAVFNSGLGHIAPEDVQAMVWNGQEIPVV